MKRFKFIKPFFLLTVFFIGFQSRGYDSDKVIKTNIRTCGIVNSEHNLMEGELSDYWAQELIGSDLLREELKEIPPPSQTNFISVFDADTEDDHLHEVRHLISGHGNYAVLPELGDKISVFGTIEALYINMKKHLLVTSQFKESGEIPSFINHSLSWMVKGETIYKSFKSLSPAIVVTASGNHFPLSLNNFKSQASLDFNTIIVGSFSPDGFASEFSKEGEEVWILAPSDQYITSANSDGEYSLFGGTSGAAPLVTGALAGFEWISDYHPTGEEAKILLSKTAIPTLHSHEKPQLNGAGLLNAYKLGRVAKRLKDKCKKNQTENQIGYQTENQQENQTDEDCFQKEIRNEENYLFPYSPLKDEEFGLTLSQAFPSCSFVEKAPTAKPHYPSCDEKAEVFKRLKRQVLLSPERKELWELLSCIYRKAGFSSNALMLDHIALALTPTNSLGNEFLDYIFPLFTKSYGKYRRLSFLIMQVLLDEGREDILLVLSQSPNAHVRLSLASISSFLREEVAFSLLNQLIQDPMYRVIKAAALSAGRIGGDLGFNLLNQLIQNPDPVVRKIVAEAAGVMGGELGFNLLKQLIQDPDLNVREGVAEAAGVIGGNLGLSLLNQLIQDPDLGIKWFVAVSVGRIGGELGLSLLNQLIQDEHEHVRGVVADAAGVIGGKLGFSLLNQLIQDPESYVRRFVALSAGEIGEELGSNLLKQLAQNPDPMVGEAIAYSKMRP